MPGRSCGTAGAGDATPPAGAHRVQDERARDREDGDQRDAEQQQPAGRAHRPPTSLRRQAWHAGCPRDRGRPPCSTPPPWYPLPTNEPVRQYVPGSPERASLEARVKELAGSPVDLTMTVGGEQRRGCGAPSTSSSRTGTRAVLGTTHEAGAADVAGRRRRGARGRARAWRALSYDDRAAVLLRAADLLAGPWRDTLNAATMLGQSKSCYQAEIDSACELIDFLRFNVAFGAQVLAEQPVSSRACGTGWTTARSRASCWPSRRSTSPRSPATCRSRRR